MLGHELRPFGRADSVLLTAEPHLSSPLSCLLRYEWISILRYRCKLEYYSAIKMNRSHLSVPLFLGQSYYVAPIGYELGLLLPASQMLGQLRLVQVVTHGCHISPSALYC